MPQFNNFFKYEFNYHLIVKANNNGRVPLWHFSLVDQNNIAKREGVDNLNVVPPAEELNLSGDWTELLESCVINNPHS